MICVPPLIAAMQYRAVFRRSENAARHVGNYLFIAGGLLAILFAMLTCIYAVNKQEIDVPGLAVLSSLTTAFLYILFCGWTNQQWAKQLQQWRRNAEKMDRSLDYATKIVDPMLRVEHSATLSVNDSANQRWLARSMPTVAEWRSHAELERIDLLQLQRVLLRSVRSDSRRRAASRF